MSLAIEDLWSNKGKSFQRMLYHVSPKRTKEGLQRATDPRSHEFNGKQKLYVKLGFHTSIVGCGNSVSIMPGVAMSSMCWKHGGVGGEDDHLEVAGGRFSIQRHSKCLPDLIPFTLCVLFIELSNRANRQIVVQPHGWQRRLDGARGDEEKRKVLF